ncbi:MULTISPECIES: TetR/AcrR family transcriptional regulator [unclassified Chelatococcus]|uniref:TetR/AcrR family transcriptional regulator n=1 Tax=unclassified Chelatococcus TaxID=2638111 RepID=UPI001BD1BC60|nr:MULTISPECIES: TetR/AcrR family transcriptional regulator [unclassified Chelatococcus]MBS7743475.1 TetR family transcriptional regulator [Chelatococcus sp. HY11]MBX3547085.1 TetR family transcriptional regulator [Chelatococcus sp.]
MSGEERKADLLEAALRVFSEKGYNRASLQDIANSVGILKGSLYYYYKSKEALLFDVLKFVHDEHLANAQKLASGSGDPLSRLRALLEGHAAFVCDNLDRTTVFVREMDRLPARLQTEILGADRAYQSVFRNLIIAAQGTGQVPASVHPKLATLWILGSLNWLHRWYRPERAGGSSLIAAQFADQLTRAIAPSPLWNVVEIDSRNQDR